MKETKHTEYKYKNKTICHLHNNNSSIVKDRNYYQEIRKVEYTGIQHIQFVFYRSEEPWLV